MTQETLAAAQAVHSNGDVITSQLAGAALLAYLLQWVKSSKWVPWITDHTKGINYALTGLLSLAATIGIHYQFDATAGVLTIGGLHASSILAGLWEWVKQWAFQQGAADLIFTKAVVKDVQSGDVARPTGLPTGTGTGVAILLAVALSASACASAGTVLYEADHGIHATLTTVDDTVNRACSAGLRSAEDCKTFNAVLADSYAAYRRFNGPAQEGSIAGVPAMVSALADLRGEVAKLAPQAKELIADLERWYTALKGLLPKESK